MILFLKPYFEYKPWAGDKLTKIYDCNQGIGEAWIISGYNKKSSIITNGEFKGQSLRHLWHSRPDLFGEIAYNEKEFPILVKLISASDDLSVQVHPSDEYALKRHNSLGKFECWYVLDENKATNVILGVNVKNSFELDKIIKDGTLEDYLIKKQIKKDDLIIIEPGTVHALQRDSFILEVQESSDLTYRLYDYDRKPCRQLHIEDSLNVIKYHNNKNEIHSFKNQDKFKNKHFDLDKIIIDKKMNYPKHGLTAFYVIKGEGNVNEIKIKKGDSFIATYDKNETELIFDGKLEIIAIIPNKKGNERLKMRKVALITGIVGQDGLALTDLLLEKDYEIHGLIQSKSQLDNSNIRYLVENKKIYNERVFFHIGDMTDTSNINRLLEKIRPDEIYHLASQSHVDISFDIPEYTTQVNGLGTLRLLDAIKENDYKTRLFNLSTCYLFDGNVVPQNELTPYNPKSPYAISKLYAHQMVKMYRENYGLYAVNGIFYNRESKRRPSSYVAKKIVSAALRISKGEEFVLELGNLDSYREWGFAHEYANAMWKMLQLDKPEDFVVGTGVVYSVRQLVEKVFLSCNVKIEWIGKGLDEKGINKETGKVLIKINPKYVRLGEPKVLQSDSSVFTKKTGIKLKDELNEIINELKEEA